VRCGDGEPLSWELFNLGWAGTPTGTGGWPRQGIFQKFQRGWAIQMICTLDAKGHTTTSFKNLSKYLSGCQRHLYCCA
jgi:hypothetical protein